MKKKGYNEHTGLWREKPCKNLEEKRQKIAVEPCRVGERKKFWKRCLNKSNLSFFFFKKKLIYNFQLIEIDKSSQKILKEISNRKQIGSIENMEKQNFREKQPDF